MAQGLWATLLTCLMRFPVVGLSSMKIYTGLGRTLASDRMYVFVSILILRTRVLGKHTLIVRRCRLEEVSMLFLHRNTPIKHLEMHQTSTEFLSRVARTGEVLHTRRLPNLIRTARKVNRVTQTIVVRLHVHLMNHQREAVLTKLETVGHVVSTHLAPNPRLVPSLPLTPLAARTVPRIVDRVITLPIAQTLINTALLELNHPLIGLLQIITHPTITNAHPSASTSSSAFQETPQRMRSRRHIEGLAYLIILTVSRKLIS
jgi:hypothetical protein